MLKYRRLSFIVILLISLSSCLPTYVNSLRLYDRESGNTIHVALSDPKSNQGFIYQTEHDSNPNSEAFDGEYHIYGERRRYEPRRDRS